MKTIQSNIGTCTVIAHHCIYHFSTFALVTLDNLLNSEPSQFPPPSLKTVSSSGLTMWHVANQHKLSPQLDSQRRGHNIQDQTQKIKKHNQSLPS